MEMEYKCSEKAMELVEDLKEKGYDKSLVSSAEKLYEDIYEYEMKMGDDEYEKDEMDKMDYEEENKMDKDSYKDMDEKEMRKDMKKKGIIITLS